MLKLPFLIFEARLAQNSRKFLYGFAKDYSKDIDEAITGKLAKIKARKEEEKRIQIATGGGLIEVPEGKKISSKPGPNNVSPRKLAEMALKAHAELLES